MSADEIKSETLATTECFNISHYTYINIELINELNKCKENYFKKKKTSRIEPAPFAVHNKIK